MTNDGQNALVYDAVNRMTGSNGSLGSGTYGYDGKGHRVEKVAAGVTTVYIYSGSKVIAEYLNGASPSSPTTEYIYGGSALVAKIQSTAVTYYNQDQESNRIVTNSSGAITEQLGAFPFGEPWYNTTQEKWLFTSYERDMESQNDYAMNRYYVNRLGRFSSADSAGGSSTDPQSLNRFSYAGNDPVNQIDPSGAVTIVLFNFGGGGGDFWACLYSTDFGCDSEYSEFDNIGVIATGELYWSSGVNTDFEDYQADGQLQNKVAEGEIVDLGPVTIYGSVDLSVGQNGPGGPPQPNVLQNAIKRALEALSDPKCVQSLFRSDVDPTYLLNQLVNGTLGSIAIGDLGGVSGGGVFAGVTTAIDEPYVNAGIPTASITGANVTISGNAASPFFSGYPSNPYGPYGNDVGQAVTIIHELGHVANDLYGAGASALLGDQDNPALSAINSILVINGCFGGPK
jgi:RHS repeat-associated protein